MRYKIYSTVIITLFGMSCAGCATTIQQENLVEIEDEKVLIVSGNSMSPTINSGAQIKLIFEPAKEYQRGDIVAIKFKTRERMILKRIIALPDDKVEYRSGQLYVNDALLQMEGWSVDRHVPKRSWKILGIQLKRYGGRVPSNSLIVMGDNAKNSYDSGDFGLLSMSQIEGRVVH